MTIEGEVGNVRSLRRRVEWAGEAVGRSMTLNSMEVSPRVTGPKIRPHRILHDNSSFVFAPVAGGRLLWVEQVELPANLGGRETSAYKGRKKKQTNIFEISLE